jgi:hypothetical protein
MRRVSRKSVGVSHQAGAGNAGLDGCHRLLLPGAHAAPSPLPRPDRPDAVPAARPARSCGPAGIDSHGPMDLSNTRLRRNGEGSVAAPTHARAAPGGSAAARARPAVEMPKEPESRRDAGESELTDRRIRHRCNRRCRTRRVRGHAAVGPKRTAATAGSATIGRVPEYQRNPKAAGMLAIPEIARQMASPCGAAGRAARSPCGPAGRPARHDLVASPGTR